MDNPTLHPLSLVQAINYVSRYNLTTNARYGYTSGGTAATGTCNGPILTSTVTGQAVQLSGSASRVSPSNSEAALMAAVTISPVTVYFDVEASFQGYGGGIYSGTDCGTSINHASRFISLSRQF